MNDFTHKKIGIVGLRISALDGDPQSTLMGNPVRSWALFSGLGAYDFDTELFVDKTATIGSKLSARFEGRLVRDYVDFLNRAKEKYDAVIICGTRIQTTLEQHGWLTNLTGCPVFLAQCYHNVETPVPAPLVDQIVGATFVTPRYQHRWTQDYPTHRAGLMTTGEVSKPPTADVANGDAVFMGHIHSHAIIKKMTQVASMSPERNFHIVSSRIRVPQSNPAEYVAFAGIDTEEERQHRFKQILDGIGAEKPDNFQYHFLPPGSEDDLMNRVSVGLDFCWNPDWLLDNSKVPNYLSYGLNVVTHLPAPSYRFVRKFGAGRVLDHAADAYKWRDAIQEAGELSVARKNQLRTEAGAYFSWTNATYDLAAIMMDYFDQSQA